VKLREDVREKSGRKKVADDDEKVEGENLKKSMVLNRRVRWGEHDVMSGAHLSAIERMNRS
jgi:hypothetical protein